MSEKMKKIQEFLASEYGITTPEELLIAVEKDKGVDVGIFTCERNGGQVVVR